MPNAPAASRALGVVSMHASIHSGGTGSIRHSPRDGLRLIRDLPGDRAFLPPSSARRVSVIANLTSASGSRQDSDIETHISGKRKRNFRVGDPMCQITLMRLEKLQLEIISHAIAFPGQSRAASAGTARRATHNPPAKWRSCSRRLGRRSLAPSRHQRRMPDHRPLEMTVTT